MTLTTRSTLSLTLTLVLLLFASVATAEDTRIPLAGNWQIADQFNGPIEPTANQTQLGWFDWAENHFVLGRLECSNPDECYFADLLTYPVPNAEAGEVLLPLVGDWDGDGRDEVGVFEPETGKAILFLLRWCAGGGVPCLQPIEDFKVAGEGPEDWLLMASWGDHGDDDVGLYNGDLGKIRLVPADRASSQFAHTFFLGTGLATPVPVAGDWNGDGLETVGVYDRSTQLFYFVNEHSAAAPQVFNLGALTPLSSASLPFAGGSWFGEPFVGILEPGEFFCLYWIAEAPGSRGPIFVYVPKDPSR